MGWVITKFFDISKTVSVFRGTASSIGHYKYENYEDFEKEACVWLPRQDQLQGIYHSLPKDGLVYCGNWFYDVTPALLEKLRLFLLGYKTQLFSMEQLWLAFVMSELYQKRWDGEQWITSKH